MIKPMKPSKPAPALVVLYVDPFRKTDHRISYWVENPGHAWLLVEEQVPDTHGVMHWGSASGFNLAADRVLAHALVVGLKPATATIINGVEVPTYDLRAVTLPAPPPV